MSLRLSLSAALLLVLSAAHAGRPLVTEDAGVLARGECEIEAFGERRHQRGEPSVDGGSLEPGCGIGWRTQLSLTSRRFNSMPNETQIGFTGKTAIIELTESSAGLTLGYSFDWSRQSDQSLRSNSGLLVAVVTLPFRQDWLAHVNVGWQRNQQPRESFLFWGVAIERESVGGIPLDLMAESYREDGASPWVALGARYRVIREGLSVNASIALKTGN